MPRFLGTYSEEDIRGFFEDFKLPEGPYKGRNFNQMFEDLGFKDLVFDIDVSDSFVHRVQLFNHSKTPENLLAQFVTKHATSFLPSLTPLFPSCTVLHALGCCLAQTVHSTRDDIQCVGHQEV